jgi:CheY-like chemotaxis protein
VAQAVYALTQFSGETASQVLRQEERVNQMEVEIDRDLSGIIARRQPTARDLRLLIAVSKTIANLERVGDEAARIARTVQRLINTGVSSRLRLPVSDLSFEAEPGHRAAAQGARRLRPAGHHARAEVLKQDDQIDQEFDGLLRKLITYMMEDPRTISASASTWCSWPRPSSAWATTPRTWPRPSSTSSRAPTCATTRSDGSSRECDHEQHPGRRGRAGDRRADRHQPAPRRARGDAGRHAEQAQHAIDAVLPDLVLLDWMLPGESGLAAGAALARRRRARASCRSSCSRRAPTRPTRSWAWTPVPTTT